MSKLSAFLKRLDRCMDCSKENLNEYFQSSRNNRTWIPRVHEAHGRDKVVAQVSKTKFFLFVVYTSVHRSQCRVVSQGQSGTHGDDADGLCFRTQSVQIASKTTDKASMSLESRIGIRIEIWYHPTKIVHHSFSVTPRHHETASGILRRSRQQHIRSFIAIATRFRGDSVAYRKGDTHRAKIRTKSRLINTQSCRTYN